MAYVEADSFTTVERVRALVARVTAYDDVTPTKPSLQQVLDRMAQQAGRIEAVMLKAGYAGTVPSGVNPVTHSTLAKLCDECNAFLAAAYVLQMHDVRDTDKALFDAYLRAAEGETEFGTQIGGLLAAIADLVGTIIAAGRAITNHDIETEMVDMLHPVTERW